MKKGTRLDAFLAERRLSDSIEQAKRAIVSGWVKVDGETVREPSRLLDGLEMVVVERPKGSFASRGGEKLDHAMRYFGITVEGRTAVDLGASSGGFTDCLLVRGARSVYAIDVGYGQLDYRLRLDPRVTVVERLNARNIQRDIFREKIDFLTADLSFISLLKIAGVIRNVIAPDEGLLLIKPQFEAGKNEHKKGVVKKKEHHKAILGRVMPALHGQGLLFKGLCGSPLRGPAGNIEFFMYFVSGSPGPGIPVPDDIREEIDRAVESSHEALGPVHGG